MKSGNLNFLEPSGPFQACNGTDYSRGPNFGCLWTLQHLDGISEFGLGQGCIAAGICVVLAAEALRRAESPPKVSYQISTELILADLILKTRGLEFQEVKKEWLHFHTFCLKYCLVLITTSGELPVSCSVRKSVNSSARQLFAIGENLLAHVKHCCRFFWVSFVTRQRLWHKLPVYIIFAKFPHKFANLMTACSRNMQLQPKQNISNTIHYRLHSTTAQVRCSYWVSNKILCFYKTRRFINDPKACLWPSGSSMIQKPASDPLVHQWSKSLLLTLWFISDPKACLWTLSWGNKTVFTVCLCNIHFSRVLYYQLRLHLPFDAF